MYSNVNYESVMRTGSESGLCEAGTFSSPKCCCWFGPVDAQRISASYSICFAIGKTTVMATAKYK